MWGLTCTFPAYDIAPTQEQTQTFNVTIIPQCNCLWTSKNFASTLAQRQIEKSSLIMSTAAIAMPTVPRRAEFSANRLKSHSFAWVQTLDSCLLLVLLVGWCMMPLCWHPFGNTWGTWKKLMGRLLDREPLHFCTCLLGVVLGEDSPKVPPMKSAACSPLHLGANWASSQMQGFTCW